MCLQAKSTAAVFQTERKESEITSLRDARKMQKKTGQGVAERRLYLKVNTAQ